MQVLSRLVSAKTSGRRGPRPSARPGIEQLEARELLSGNPLTPPPGLHDPVVARVADAEFVQDNGSLSRLDVINLLGVVAGTETPVFAANGQVSFSTLTPTANPGLTQSEFTDLLTIVQNPCAWGLTADVADLAGKVVNSNPANLTYQGQPLLATGQLTPGTPGAALQDLVNKWFYGTDLPAVAAAAANNNIPGTVVYQQAQGTLFGANGPKSSDVAQGWVGDCYFLSSLGEVAQQSPQTIKSMFVNNGDGTYAVRFYQLDACDNTWHPDYVTVNLQLPAVASGQYAGEFAFAGWYQGGKADTYNNPSNVLWVGLAEKAYAQLAQEGWSRSTGQDGTGISGSLPTDWNQDSYDALSSGSGAVALQQLTGATHWDDIGLAKATTADKNALVQAFDHGSLVIFGSLSTEPKGVPTNAAGAPLIIAGHVYALEAIDKDADAFTLVNPYDDSSAYPGDGQRTVTLSWAQLKEYLHDYVVMAPPPICPEHAVEQIGKNTGINGGAAALDVTYYVNGKRACSIKDVKEGDVVTVTFKTAMCAPKTQFSLVSYAAPNGTLNSWNIDHQQEWCDDTVTATGGGQYSLTVTVPDGYFQVDFVRGDAISDFATGERYHSDGTFIAGVFGGCKVVSCGCC
jgi:hypothetical protein